MEGDEGLPLIIGEASIVGVALLVVALGCVDFYALVLHHDESGIDPLDLGNELLLGDGTGVGLLDEVRRVVVMLGRSAGPGALGLGALATGGVGRHG